MAKYIKELLLIYISNNFFMNWTKIQPVLLSIWCVSKIWIGWVLIHYSASKLYTTRCSGDDLWTVMWSPLTSQTPPCKGLLWAISTSSEAIKHMWILAGGWVVMKLTNTLKYKED